MKNRIALNEDHSVQDYKGYELDINLDTIDTEEETAEIKVAIRKDDKIVNWARGLKKAREWVDKQVAEEEKRKKAEQERLKNLNFDIEFDDPSNQFVDFETDFDDEYFG